jgi:hypothetical protein
MSGLDSRLSKIMPVLSAKERAVLALRAQNAAQDAPDVWRSMPAEQRHEYNLYMALAFVAGCQMGALVHVIKNQVDNLEFDLDRIDLLERAATVLEEDDPESVASHPVRPWRQPRGRHEQVMVPEFLRSLAAEIREDAFKELCVRWQELRAVEIVAGDISQIFDGEDALHPDVHEWLDACRQAGLRYMKRLGKKRLPEPADDYLERTHALVDQGFAALGLAQE